MINAADLKTRGEASATAAPLVQGTGRDLAPLAREPEADERVAYRRQGTIGGGRGQANPGGPYGRLTRIEAHNMAIATIAELAGASYEAADDCLERRGLDGALAYYGLSLEAFFASLRPRLVAIVLAARGAERITDRQAEDLIGEIDQGPWSFSRGRRQRRTVLSGLVKAANRTALAGAVADLSGQPRGEVLRNLHEEGRRSALDGYDVDLGDLRRAVKRRAVGAVDRARRDGLITPYQAEKLARRMDQGGRDRTLSLP